MCAVGLMRRLLMVSYYFPPLGGIGALRALAFAEHLREFGWEPTVLAPSNGAYFRDPSLGLGQGQVVRTWSLELSRLGKRALGTGGDDVRPAEVGPVLARARTVARRCLYFPDAQIGWYPAAVAAGLRRLHRGGFDAIFSSSSPITSHLIARTLHRRARVPWVAEFRDPWGAVEGGREARLERSLVDEASAVVMPSPSWASEHATLWRRPVVTIPNGYGSVPPASPPRSDELVVCFLGTYHPGRQDLSAVWKALTAIARVTPVRLRVVGEASPAMRAELRACGAESLLEVTGFLAHDQALRHTSSASVLLAAGPARVDEGWIPAKLFEYLPTGLPIVWVGATPNDGASLLAGHPGCRILATDDLNGVADALRTEAGKSYARELRGLSRGSRAQALAQVLEECRGR